MQVNKKDEKPQDDSIKLNQIVKVFIFIIGFSLIMRSDLWVSMCALVVVGGYLIRAFLLKQAKNGINIARAREIVLQWYQQNIMNKSEKDNKDKVKKAPSKERPLQFPVIEFEPRPASMVVHQTDAPVFDWNNRQVMPVNAAQPFHHHDVWWDMDTALSILYDEPEPFRHVRQDIDDDVLLRLGVVDSGLHVQEDRS